MCLKKSRAAFARPLVAAVLLVALVAPSWAADEWTLIGKSNYGEYYLRRSSVYKTSGDSCQSSAVSLQEKQGVSMRTICAEIGRLEHSALCKMRSLFAKGDR